MSATPEGANMDRSPAPRRLPRTALVAAGAAGVLMASSLWLWARHGTAVFHEMIVAGLALCF